MVASHNPANDSNLLYSLDARNCIVATMYNSAAKKGAMIQFDNNIGAHINSAIEKALEQIDGLSGKNSENIEASMTGGVWLLGGQNIGAPVKETLARYGVDAPWDDWSFSPCIEHSYGVILELDTGKLRIFEHPPVVAEDFYAPLLSNANSSTEKWQFRSSEQQRVDSYVGRCSAAAIREDWNGRISFVEKSGSVVTRGDINRQRILMRNLDNGREETHSPTRSPVLKASGAAQSDSDGHVAREFALNGVPFKVAGRYEDVKAYLDVATGIQSQMNNKSVGQTKERLEGIRLGQGAVVSLEMSEVKFRRQLFRQGAHASGSSRSGDSFESTDSSGVSFLGGKKSRQSSKSGSLSSFSSSSSSLSDAPSSPLKLQRSAIYEEQARIFSPAQEKIMSTALERLQERRDRAHPVYRNNFGGSSDKAAIESMFGQITEKLYSDDLPNWEQNGGGRGAWRLVFKRIGGNIGLLGVYDTHTLPYRRWS